MPVWRLATYVKLNLLSFLNSCNHLQRDYVHVLLFLKCTDTDKTKKVHVHYCILHKLTQTCPNDRKHYQHVPTQGHDSTFLIAASAKFSVLILPSHLKVLLCTVYMLSS